MVMSSSCTTLMKYWVTVLGGLLRGIGCGVAKETRSGDVSRFLFHAGSVIDVFGGGRTFGVVVGCALVENRRTPKNFVC